MKCVHHFVVLMLAFGAMLPTAHAGAQTTTVYVARHAEKILSGRDPVLTKTGREQARQLRRIFRTTPLRAIYATRYRRTQLTASPTARSHKLRVRVSKLRPKALARHVLAEHAGHHVFVVGHSETLPSIIAALGAKSGPTIGPNAYGDLYVIKVTKGRTSVRIIEF